MPDGHVKTAPLAHRAQHKNIGKPMPDISLKDPCKPRRIKFIVRRQQRYRGRINFFTYHLSFLPPDKKDATIFIINRASLCRA